MTYEVDVAGQRCLITIEPAGDGDGRYRVAIEGRAQVLEAERLDSTTIFLRFVERGVGEEIRIVDGADNGTVDVYLRSAVVRAMVDRRRRSAAGEPSDWRDGEQRVVAPMPGKVVRVLVAPGDEVQPRQGLVVIEAMKMENELSAPRAGRVKTVAVEQGLSVETGRLLVIVE